MSTTPKTLTLPVSTSRANPTPQPMKRLTVPRIRQRKGGEPLVMLTAYTVRMAQLMDPHCDMLLVGDSLAQVMYGLPHTVAVTMEMMALHGAAVVRGSYHAAVIVYMPFGSYEASPEQAFTNASRLLKETGAAGVKVEGGKVIAPTIEFLTARGIPVMGHVGLTPQAVNILGGYGVRGKSAAEARSIVEDAEAVARAGAFALVIEGVMEPIAIEITNSVGGIPAITAATVIIAGMSGQMVGYRIMSVSTVNRPMSQGISIGTASHAMGIAASLERGRKFAAYASLGLIFNGILTAILVPILLPLMGVS